MASNESSILGNGDITGNGVVSILCNCSLEEYIPTPLEPTNLIATTDDSSVSISFTPPYTGAHTITNYQYSLNGGTTFSAFSPAQTTSPVTITGLTNGTSYNIVLKAVNQYGTGVASLTITVTPNVPFRWDSTHAGDSLGVYDNGLTARQLMGKQNSILGTRQIAANEKAMYSVSVTTASTNLSGVVVGFGTTSMNYSNGNGQFGNYMGNDANSIGVAGDGSFYYGGSEITTGLPTYGTLGDIIDVAIYEGHGWWVRVNGGYWNNDSTANPATNTGSLTVESLTNLYPGVTPFGFSVLGAMTINTTSTYSVPSGYILLY